MLAESRLERTHKRHVLREIPVSAGTVGRMWDELSACIGTRNLAIALGLHEKCCKRAMEPWLERLVQLAALDDACLLRLLAEAKANIAFHGIKPEFAE